MYLLQTGLVSVIDISSVCAHLEGLHVHVVVRDVGEEVLVFIGLALVRSLYPVLGRNCKFKYVPYRLGFVCNKEVVISVLISAKPNIDPEKLCFSHHKQPFLRLIGRNLLSR